MPNVLTESHDWRGLMLEHDNITNCSFYMGTYWPAPLPCYMMMVFVNIVPNRRTVGWSVLYELINMFFKKLFNKSVIFKQSWRPCPQIPTVLLYKWLDISNPTCVWSKQHLQFIMGTCLYLSLLVFCGIAHKIQGAQDPNTYVIISLGHDQQLRGLNTTSGSGHRVYKFNGIPYAQPPLGWFCRSECRCVNNSF